MATPRPPSTTTTTAVAAAAVHRSTAATADNDNTDIESTQAYLCGSWCRRRRFCLRQQEVHRRRPELDRIPRVEFLCVGGSIDSKLPFRFSLTRAGSGRETRDARVGGWSEILQMLSRTAAGWWTRIKSHRADASWPGETGERRKEALEACCAPHGHTHKGQKSRPFPTKCVHRFLPSTHELSKSHRRHPLRGSSPQPPFRSCSCT